MKSRPELIQEIDQTLTATPTLWWLGHAGFVIRFAHITFYVDPCLSREGALLSSSDVTHADNTPMGMYAMIPWMCCR